MPVVLKVLFYMGGETFCVWKKAIVKSNVPICLSPQYLLPHVLFFLYIIFISFSCQYLEGTVYGGTQRLESVWSRVREIPPFTPRDQRQIYLRFQTTDGYGITGIQNHDHHLKGGSVTLLAWVKFVKWALGGLRDWIDTTGFEYSLPRRYC